MLNLDKLIVPTAYRFISYNLGDMARKFLPKNLKFLDYETERKARTAHPAVHSSYFLVRFIWRGFFVAINFNCSEIGGFDLSSFF
jgi:hypothetical protein